MASARPKGSAGAGRAIPSPATAGRDPRDSLVLQVPAAEPDEAESRFLQVLSFETDASDVHADLAKGITLFVVVDCRSPEEYAAGHVPGAVNWPYRSITAETVASSAKDQAYVVYDAGHHDNAATKTCLRLAALGLRVKEMIGGLAAWKHEGYSVAAGNVPGKLMVKPALQRR